MSVAFYFPRIMFLITSLYFSFTQILKSMQLVSII